jgi:hypothetical protein
MSTTNTIIPSSQTQARQQRPTQHLRQQGQVNFIKQFFKSYGVETKHLQSGGMGCVFKIDGENLVKLSRASRLFYTNGQEIAIPSSSQNVRKEYVIKVYFPSKTEKLKQRLVENFALFPDYTAMVASIPQQRSRNAFILPLIGGYLLLNDDLVTFFEIQEYGGLDILQFLEDHEDKKIPIPNQVIRKALVSLINCLEGIVYLITTLRYMILDIKAVNMVIEPSTGVTKMIDVEWVDVENFTTRGHIFTPDMQSMPPQMLASILEQSKQFQKYSQDVKSRYSQFLPTLFSQQQFQKYKKKAIQQLPPTILHDLKTGDMPLRLAYYHTGWSILNIMLLLLTYRPTTRQSQQAYKQQNKRFLESYVRPFRELGMINTTKGEMTGLISSLRTFVNSTFPFQQQQQQQGQGRFQQMVRT